MSAPVDVLAVMDEAAKDYADSSFHSSYENEMREARAAVAELVAASEVLRAEWDRQDNGKFDAMPAKDFFAAEARWRAALAKFGGAA